MDWLINANNTTNFKFLALNTLITIDRNKKIKTPPLAQCKEAGLCKSTALGGLFMMQCVPHDILRADPQLL